MATYTFKLHGPSAEPIKVALASDEQANADHWLETFAAWMQTGDVHDLPLSGRGECRVNFAKVWAVEFTPPGRVAAL